MRIEKQQVSTFETLEPQSVDDGRCKASVHPGPAIGRVVPSDLERLTQAVVSFRDERDWKQFHNGKDLAVSLVLEASEFLELYQWQAEGALPAERMPRAAEELADVLYWTLLAAHELGIDLEEAFRAKMTANADKYPIDKAKASSRKYTEL